MGTSAVNLELAQIAGFMDPELPRLVSAKRTRSERSGTHAWHAYYGGYSEAFVASALGYLDCNPGTMVLDPWGGSGTTSVVSARQGVPSVCMDINPAMAIFASAKSPVTLRHADEVLSFFGDLGDLARPSSEMIEPDSLETMFTLGSANLIRNVIRAIPFPSSAIATQDEVRQVLTATTRDASLLISPEYAFCMAVVFVTARQLYGTKKEKNPTWVKTNGDRVTLRARDLHRALHRNATSMLADLCRTYAGFDLQTPSFALCADVKALPFRDSSVPRVITSPPYLTRIDYAVSTTPELALLGGAELLRTVRDQTMGAPVITKDVKEQRERWGLLANCFLNSVKTHDTKAAASYYWKNIVQYFMDADAALAELLRVMMPGGKGLIVVQSSYFKEIEIPLGDIYVEMAQSVGFASHIAFREEVRGHMAHVNTKSSGYKKDKVYYEDSVFIEKPRNR